MRKRERRSKRSLTIIMASAVCLLVLMTAGYAAFSTNINITAKGNVINNSFSIDSLKDKVVTSGDGLYVDPVEENRYVYRGADPDNYVTFNGEEAGWRIIAIEPDGTLKLRKIESIGDLQYDSSNRNGSSSYYCYDPEYGGIYGCNVWGSISTMLDANGNNITSIQSVISNSTLYTLPDTEATLNTYLNTTYYNSLSNEAKNMIETHSFNVGLLDDNSEQTLETDIEQEKTYTWKGNIALINVTDYVRASSDSACTSTYAGTPNPSPCANGNYLYDSTTLPAFTLSLRTGRNPDGGPRKVWYIQNVGNIALSTAIYVSFPFATNPVLYIKADTSLTGSGTVGDPYVLK